MNSYSYDEIKKDIMMNINLIDGDEYRNTLLAISNIASDILVKTLGPFASTTTIDDGASTYSTKDGWNVLNRLQFGDPVQETLFKFLQKISFTLNSRVGDGTTTALVSANQFISILNAYREMLSRKGIFTRQADLLDTIEEAKNEVIEKLKSPERKKTIVKTDNGYEDIYKIAYVSSNRNEKISRLIKDIYDETDNPNIHVTYSDTSVTYSDIQRGYKLDTELLFDKFYLDSEDKYLLSDGALIWFFDHNVKFSEHFQVIQSILRYANSQHKSAIIFAPSFDDTFVSSMHGSLLSIAKQGGIPAIVLVRVPLTNAALKNYASDFAVLTNTTLFNYTKVRMFNFLLKHSKGEEEPEDSQEFNDLFAGESYSEPENIIETCSGVANRITIMKKSVLLEDFTKDSKLYQNTLKEITENFEVAKEKFAMHGEVLSKDYMESHLRLVKFMGNTGVIHVGGDSELNKKCAKDAVDDAVLACRSAFENGYIRGLNLETISAACECYDNTPESMKKDAFAMIAATFCRTSFAVMMNKFDGGTFVPAEYKWGTTVTEEASKRLSTNPDFEIDIDELRSADSFFNNEGLGMRINPIYDEMMRVIETCTTFNLGYDIVTETYEEAGESVINSVSTDIEILNATTSIITLLLSSNQLLSINRRFDKKSSREYTLNARKDDGFAFASGIADAFKDKGCYLFTTPLESAGYVQPIISSTEEIRLKGEKGPYCFECDDGCDATDGDYCDGCMNGCWKNRPNET